ncbi:MAG: glycoside hydrolase family 127 protein [Chloroflexota bacterium]|nr:glycoside hydrolase family 127 protein [Chloroflexota bacterium]PLS77529.1 MAG: glycoside hydrolase family 127 protein [Chloroflexota bacterium]
MAVTQQPEPVVVDTSRSQHTQLQPVPITAVSLTDQFWAPRRHTNHTVTLPSQFQQLESSHRLDNFRRVSGKLDRPFEGPIFNDTDVYKWLEAAAWTLASENDRELERLVDIAITEVGDAQQPDGYLHTYFVGDKAHERWTNLRDLHEMYNAGHLTQAAVAHYRATGSRRLLDIACRFADHICDTFGPEEEGKRVDVDGHEEVEMALVELARATGNDKYRKQAQFFVDVRGRGVIGGRPYHQDHTPLRELSTMDGHAVRAVYYNTGAADLYAESGEQAVRDALNRMWHNMVTRRMYVSSGIGSRYDWEAFGKDFELPNERAYTETCAAIGNVMWNWRMLAIDGDARFADLMEQSLYNGVLPGLSLDGQEYFYQNPLEDDGTHRRQPWFGCACCPPNVARLLASLPGYFYNVSDAGIWVHLYAEGQAEIKLQDGRTIRLQQRTRYPWDGAIEVEVTGEGTFSLFLRIPGWCEEGATLEVNGSPYEGPVEPGTYAEVRREWRPGDVVRLTLPMPVRQIEAHPYVAEDRGRVAVMRGPLLYCIEQADNPGFDPRDVTLPADSAFSPEFRDDLLGGLSVLRTRAKVQELPAEWAKPLYRTVKGPRGGKPQEREVDLVAIPYLAWANREPGRMQVWLRLEGL